MANLPPVPRRVPVCESLTASGRVESLARQIFALGLVSRDWDVWLTALVAAVNGVSGLSALASVISLTQPTFVSGFGGPTGRSITGTALSFSIVCGNNGADTDGVLGLSTAPHGWTVFMTNVTATGGLGSKMLILQSASTVSSATVMQFDLTGTSTPFATGDVLNGMAVAF
jgi:hypothetical protein